MKTVFNVHFFKKKGEINLLSREWLITTNASGNKKPASGGTISKESTAEIATVKPIGLSFGRNNSL
jgi:hypothetical protein